MTNIEHHIEDLITVAKELPNSLERNKIVSRLEDARLFAVAMNHRLGRAPHPADQCICPEGAVDANCPIQH